MAYSRIHSEIPVSRDTVFIRGFSARQHIDDIREFFAHEGGENTVEFFKEDGQQQLFIALRFDSHEIAQDIIERFNRKDVLGDVILIQFYKDLRGRDYRNPIYRNEGYRNDDSYEYSGRGGGGDRDYPSKGSYNRHSGGGMYSSGASMKRGSSRGGGSWDSQRKHTVAEGRSKRHSSSRSRSPTRSTSRSFSRSSSGSAGRRHGRKRSPSIRNKKSKERTKSSSRTSSPSVTVPLHQSPYPKSHSSGARKHKKKSGKRHRGRSSSSQDSASYTEDRTGGSTKNKKKNLSSDKLYGDVAEERSGRKGKRKSRPSPESEQEMSEIGSPDDSNPPSKDMTNESKGGTENNVSDEEEDVRSSSKNMSKKDATAAAVSRTANTAPSSIDRTGHPMRPVNGSAQPQRSTQDSLDRVQSDVIIQLNEDLRTNEVKSNDSRLRGSGDEPNLLLTRKEPVSTSSTSAANRQTADQGISLGLSQKKIALMREKKEEIERAYRQDCETFATVTKMLISKDPDLEDRIQQSFRDNLKEIGHKCIQELREFVDELKSSE